MTRNLRTQLASEAERWIRAWSRPDVSREDAAVMVTYWHLYEPTDPELVDEVLSRFSPAEPPAVAGLDFLPAGDCPSMFQDRNEPIYSYPCRRGEGHAGKHYSRDLRHSWTDAEQYVGKLRRFADSAGDEWQETEDGLFILALWKGVPFSKSDAARWKLAELEAEFGPLAELLPDTGGWDDDTSRCARCGTAYSPSYATHCVPCDGPMRVVSGGVA